MKIHLTAHARKVVAERAIELDWILRTIDRPELRLPDPDDPTLDRLYLRITERDERVLRVVAALAVDPVRVVNVFFDRSMRGKL